MCSINTLCNFFVLLVVVAFVVAVLCINRVLKDRTLFARGLLRDLKLSTRYIIFLQNGYSIKNYLEKKGYNRIAFYGFNDLGKTVLNNLLSENVNIAFGLDEAYGEYGLNFDILHPTCQLPQVDAIFLIADNGRVRNMVKNSGDYIFVTLDDILKEHRI